MNRTLIICLIFQSVLLWGNQNLFAQKKTVINRTSEADSIEIDQLNKKIKLVYQENELDSAVFFSKKIINIGKIKNDTSYMVDGYFKTAFYQKKAFRNTAALESYLSGIQLAAKKGDSIKTVKMLLNLASLQNEMGDYNGSQLSALRGITFLSKENDKNLAFGLYQGLGNAFQEMMDYKNAISFYNKALEYAENNESKAGVLNNIANCYRKDKHIQKAIDIYQIALSDSLNMSTAILARLFDNYGLALFKNDSYGGLQFLERGLEIRLKDNNKLGICTSYLNLAQWYLRKDKNIALNYANKTIKLSKEINNSDLEMESLKLMILLKENTKQEAIRLVELQDSISTQNLQNFHQAVGIRFKTEETEKENLTLKQQNTEQTLLTEKEKAQKWILSGGLAASLAGIGIFFIVYRKNQKQKREIEKQKNLVEELQRELHHRLKNNLSFIDFFITMAKGKFPNSEYVAKLDELQNRINSMFEVHKQLYNKEDITSVNAQTYISTLVENIKKAYSNPNITLEEKVAETDLRADTSFPIGLIVNEFVTNSYKYAFPYNEKGTIFIHLKETPNAYHLHLADNGKGLPADFDIDRLNSFGMETIKLLTEEYKGTFKLDGSDGTKMDITFPK
jgi:two-component sensor histidine kinase